MSAEHLLELLKEQQERLDKEGKSWLEDYAGKSKGNPEYYSLTFYLLCKDLVEHPGEDRVSTTIQSGFKRFLKFSPRSGSQGAFQELLILKTSPTDLPKETQ